MGVCTADSVINLALCCLGYLPGLLHAWYIILKYPEPDYDSVEYEAIHGGAEPGRDVESGRVSYVYVAHQPGQTPPPQRGYGTVQSPQEQRPAGDSSHARSQSDARPPPTYAEAVRGDHKVQADD